ncbi:MAG: electron transport complex subunit RsxC [bacterium]
MSEAIAVRNIHELPGGIHPEEHKHQSTGQAIRTLPIPSQLIIPLNQHLGAPAKSLVNVGDRVLKGQMIGAPEGFVSAAVHASSSGTVAAIENRPVPHPSGMTALCIVIDTDGEDRWADRQPVGDYQNTDPAKLLDTIRNAGIAGLGGAGFPSAVKLQPRQPVDTLIINATECEPFITADDMLMREKAAEIVEGIQILSHILGEPKNIVIGIEDNKPEAYEALDAHLEGTGIELAEFHTKYPSGGEKQLIYILTGKEVPSGGLPADIGIVCQNIGTTYAIQQAVIEGKPLIERVTTLTGDAFEVQANAWALIGTPISHLLAQSGFDRKRASRLIMGGPMMGFTLKDGSVPVVKTTTCILAPTPEELPLPPPPQPCIRCGLCSEACPAGLLPQQLLWYAQSQNYDKLEAYSLSDCIECGACSYVCPSAIPLVQYYRAAKGEIREIKLQKVKSDKARERFEFNKARKEREEAEKAAKREARKKAAAKASKAGSSESKVDDIVKAALQRVQQSKQSPDEQRPRLERAVEHAKSRLDAAAAKLAEWEETGTPEQVEQGKARMQDARHRLDEAEQKLADLKSGESNTASVVKQKLSASPRALLQEKITGIEKRIATTEQKIAEATDEALRSALTSGLDKQRQKLAEAQQQLSETPEDSPTEAVQPEEQNAAAAAIARAQAKAVERASMSDKDRLTADIASLETRVTKARDKLAAAEAEASDHVDALRTGLEKLEAKLEKSRAELAESNPTN